MDPSGIRVDYEPPSGRIDRESRAAPSGEESSGDDGVEGKNESSKKSSPQQQQRHQQPSISSLMTSNTGTSSLREPSAGNRNPWPAVESGAVAATEGSAPAPRLRKAGANVGSPAVAPGAVAENGRGHATAALAGPDFKDQARSAVPPDHASSSPNRSKPGAVAEKSRPLAAAALAGPDFKDQARSAVPPDHASSSPNRSAPGAAAENRGGHAAAALVGPDFKDQARSAVPPDHASSSPKRSAAAPQQQQQLQQQQPAQPDSDLAQSAARQCQQQNPLQREEEVMEDSRRRVDEFASHSRLISAHVVPDTVEPSPAGDLARAEVMQGGIFLNRRRLLALLLAVLLAAAAVGGVCGGTDLCRASSGSSPTTIVVNNGTPAPTTAAPSASPTVAPTLSDSSQAVVEYIDSVRFSTEPILLPVGVHQNATPVELALDWMLYSDPLQLSTSSEDDRARLRQRFALATLYYSTDGPTSWINRDGWLGGGDECGWHGIVCVASAADESVVDRDGIVVVVGSDVPAWDARLDANGLRGTIPPDLALLDALRYIDLKSNAGLVGPLPPLIGKIGGSLQYLNFDDCSLSGSLPSSMANLTGLQTLQLQNNSFTGALPPLIGNWTALSWLDISQNSFSQSIPSTVGSWSQLQVRSFCFLICISDSQIFIRTHSALFANRFFKSRTT